MEVLEVTERYGLATHNGQTFLAVFRGRCRTADIVAMRARLAGFLEGAARASACSVLVFMENRATLGERGRAEIGAMLQDHPGLKAWANVVHGDGFWASAVRGITMTVLLFHKTKFPLKTFGDPDAAASWLGDGKASPSLLRLVTQLRSRVGTVPSAGAR